MRIAVLRAAFTTLDRLSPALASRWALRIWCTLPSNSGRRQDNRPYPGRLSTVRLRDGREVAVETWLPVASDDNVPDRPVHAPAPPVHAPTPSVSTSGRPVYLVHGWGGWRGQLGAFVEPLLQAGYRVVAFDVPSHGDSSPSAIGRGRATALDFTDALAAVVAEHGEPGGIVAHSLGAATTVRTVRDGLGTPRMVFVAPSPDPIATLWKLQQALGYGPRTHERLLGRLERLAGRPLDDFNAFLVDSEDAVPPAMIAHDRQDKESPYQDGVRLARTWPDAELVTTSDLGHQRILLDESVLKLAVDYLTTTPAPPDPE
ncbi:alpha/beta fold hydrolase [Phytoactinopolyspora halophila]|nr:alpha/beta fold hydrolase [Phytoactinopolyspora halophila]